jgi:hypothetical protein
MDNRNEDNYKYRDFELTMLLYAICHKDNFSLEIISTLHNKISNIVFKEQ